MVSVARWLETFTCSKYADRFERLGYSTLQSVCQLTRLQLQNLGVSPTDIHTIMENISLLQQSVHSLTSPRYLDLTSEPLPSSTIPRPFQADNVHGLHPLTESISSNSYYSQPFMPGMMYRNEFYNTPQHQWMDFNSRMIRPPSWIDHQQMMTNESYLHPLESLKRLSNLPESQVMNPKCALNESHYPPSSSYPDSLSLISNTTIVSNLLTNGLKRSSSNDEQFQSNKKSRINTEDSFVNSHPTVTSLLTRNINHSLTTMPLPSITSLQQKHSI